MKKNGIGWLIVGCLMVTALVLASCQPAAPADTGAGQTVTGKTTTPEAPKKEEPTKAEPAEEEEKGPEMIRNTAGKMQEKPRYGGTLTGATSYPMMGFDPATTVTYMNWHLIHTHDKLVMGDWTKGPAGTGETGFSVYTFLLGSATGYLAESWEFPDDETIIFHIRPGVHWQNKPPANGREFTADDVVRSFPRLFTTPESYLVATHKEGKRPTSFTALDKYTVEIKVPAGTQGTIFRDLSSQTWPIDMDIVDQDGDHKDWKRIGGTGPFQLVDWVPGSSRTYARNPNYWMKDPLTGMQLPYIDGFTHILIRDRSTRLSALRTGKIAYFPGLTWEEKDSLMQTNPELLYKTTGLSENAVALRSDRPPFDDIRVRKALFLATDNETILNDYYNGNASMLNYPVKDLADFQDAYTPLEELDEEIQELFTYNPEKARQLLADAGYPNGLKTTMIVQGNLAVSIDDATMLQAMWAKAGFDVELNIMEYGAYVSVTSSPTFTYEGGLALAGMYSSSPYKAQTWGDLNQARNLARIETPYLLEQYDRIVANFLNSEERAKILKETVPYILKNAWYMQYPNAQSYTFWWPWLKNYDAEYCLGYTNFYASVYRFGWIDQEMRLEMTGQR